MGIFTPDPEVIRLGARVLRIVSVSEPFYGILIILEEHSMEWEILRHRLYFL
ncbi:hypothetical protein SD457_00990 [Coprobacillaceae bacterium CR2/5/TPMF4]|nr:hypothetical protein SD457_00990 [Coprobacillaceae bacterium CR2/5/TPMF4]